MLSKNSITTDRVKDKIHFIRGQQILLDEDLAALYGVEIRTLNQAVKRNSERFPKDFMFQLTKKEFENLRSQFVTLRSEHGKHRKYLPYAFTEQGVAMLSGVLKSDTAVSVSIQIMNAFVVMRQFITENADVFHRLDRVEQKQLEHDKTFRALFDAIHNRETPPNKKIFFNGQVFDAYIFVSDIIRKAKKSIVIIDNYVDDSILLLLTKRKKNVQVKILTREIPKSLALDLEKHNLQYPKITIELFNHSHDRFIIIDEKEIYHVGASLKDLGKKWFAFSKFDTETIEILRRLQIGADQNRDSKIANR
ncbi:MAG: ORF6N domain-containing protein [Candidatus Woesearchaeota archaeon]